MDLHTLTSTLTPILVQQIIVVTIGTTVLIVVIMLFVNMRRQIRVDKGIRQAQGETDIALRGIKSRLNYTAQLLNNERERAGYDRVRFSDTDARSIATVFHEADMQFSACSQRLESALRALPNIPDEVSYRGVLVIIEELTPLIAPIEDALQRGIQLRTTCEATITQHTTRIDQARRSHTILAHRLNALGITVHSMLVPADKHLALAQAALASHRYADIDGEVTRALQIYATCGELLSQLVDIRDGISAGRQASEKAAIQGFDVNLSRELFVESSRLIDIALAALIAADTESARKHLSNAELTRAQAVERGGSLPVLQQRHGERIARLQQNNSHYESLSTKAYEAFQNLLAIGLTPDAEMIQTGSEAYVQAITSLLYTEQAQSMNTSQPHLQVDIASCINTAERAQQRAQTIYAIIIQRGSDMTQIELLARQEFAESEDLIRILNTQREAGVRISSDTLTSLEDAYRSARVAADATPFDGLACFHTARTVNRLLTSELRMSTAELAALVNERSNRARAMLQCQMNLVEQFMVLYPLAVAADIERGVQSMRHEVNAFDAAFHTASDMTFPLQSELYRLLQRYDRLNNALQHLHAQLSQARSAYLTELEQCSGLVRVLVQRLRQTADGEAFRIALGRLRELDEHWATRAVPRTKILQGVSDIIAHLPPASLTTERNFTPPLALTIRTWGKVSDTRMTDQHVLAPIRNAHPLW